MTATIAINRIELPPPMPLHNLESFANGIGEGWEVPAGSSGSTFGPW